MELYRPYTTPQIEDLFPGAQSLWGGQLLVTPQSIALVTRIGASGSGPQFTSPTRFCFRPDQPYTVPDAEYGWMPEPLGQHGRRGTPVHIFLREGAGEPALYLGELRLAMFTGAPDFRHQHVEFDLSPRLPRDLWLRLGGYPGWKLTVHHRELLLDVQEGERLTRELDALRDQEDLHLSLTRYEGDCLGLLANAEEAYLSYTDAEEEETWSRNPGYPEETEEVAPFFCTCGASLDMPRCYVIPRDCRVFYGASKFGSRYRWHLPPDQAVSPTSHVQELHTSCAKRIPPSTLTTLRDPSRNVSLAPELRPELKGSGSLVRNLHRGNKGEQVGL